MKLARAVPVVSADVPSGVDASTGEVAEAAVRATATVTFHKAKPGLWIAPGKQHAGQVVIAGLQLPPGVGHRRQQAREVLTGVVGRQGGEGIEAYAEAARPRAAGGGRRQRQLADRGVQPVHAAAEGEQGTHDGAFPPWRPAWRRTPSAIRSRSWSAAPSSGRPW